jgi:hypothetical protein
MNPRSFSLAIPGAALFAPHAAAQGGRTASATTRASDPLHYALIEANPALSRFSPLRHILFYDDFDNGHNGW